MAESTISAANIQSAFGVSEQRARAAARLLAGELEPDRFPAVRERLRGMWHMPPRAELVLETVNALVGGFGVEGLRIEGAWLDAYHGDIVASYVSTGDAYSATVLLDHESGDFVLTTYGDWVEGWEQEHAEDVA